MSQQVGRQQQTMLEQLLAPSAKLRYPTYHTESERGVVPGSCCSKGLLPFCGGQLGQGWVSNSPA